MVVSNSDIYSLTLCIANSFMSSYAIIHRNNQRNLLLLDEILINRFIWSITINKSVRKIDLNLSSKHFQRFFHDTSTGHPVGIIVTINQDLFIIFNSLTNAGNCLVHIVQKIWIVKL